MNAYVLDAFEFCRQGQAREETVLVADLGRVAEDCADDSGEVHWHLQGGTHVNGYPQWKLTVQATLQLMCQRCLTPFAHQLNSHTTLILARDDEKADEMEVELDDESLDVIVASRAFNILEMIEDEVLLAMPLAPRHQQCTEGAATGLVDAESDETELPFSGLKGLKQ
jgi:uncharacterized protein